MQSRNGRRAFTAVEPTWGPPTNRPAGWGGPGRGWMGGIGARVEPLIIVGPFRIVGGVAL